MLHYEKLLKAENKTVNDLPPEIKKKINGLKLCINTAKRNPNSQKAAESVEKNDLLIADAIQTWLEKDLPEPPPAETEEEKEAKRLAKEKEDKEKADAAKKEADAAAVMTARNTIVEKMNAHPQRAIEKSDLTNILGREPGKKETIGDLKLYQVYLTTKYKAER